MSFILGSEIWRRLYDSPVMAVYMLDHGELQKIPLYTIAFQSMDHIVGSSALAIRARTVGIKALDANLQ